MACKKNQPDFLTTDIGADGATWFIAPRELLRHGRRSCIIHTCRVSAMPSNQLKIEAEARVRLPDGREVVTSKSRTVPIAVPPETDKPTATVGYGSVRWKGKLYWFTSVQQRLIVAHLWEAWENGSPFVPGRALLDQADADHAAKVRDLFRDAEAWDELIVAGPTRGGPVGTFCLAFANPI
jgi:hypothetical protein